MWECVNVIALLGEGNTVNCTRMPSFIHILFNDMDDKLLANRQLIGYRVKMLGNIAPVN